MIFVVPCCFEDDSLLCSFFRFESDMLVQWFSVTADFIANLQHRVGSDVKIKEQLTRKNGSPQRKL